MRFAFLAVVSLLTCLAPGSPCAEETPPDVQQLVEQERLRSIIAGAVDLVVTASDDSPDVMDRLFEATRRVVEVGPAAVDYLVPQLDSRDPRTALFAIYALARLGAPEAEQPLRLLIERTNKRPRDAFIVRRKAWSCLALAMLGHEDAIDLLDSGGMATGHVELYRYLSFREATALFVGPAARKRLVPRIEAFDPDADPLVRRPALIEALGWVADDSVRPLLIELSEAPGLQTRQAALRVLGRIQQNKASRARLLAALGDGVERIRRTAATAVEAAGFDEVPAEVRARLEIENISAVRAPLYRLIADVEGASALPTLVSYWGRPDGVDRMRLVEAIGLGGLANGVNVLREGVVDPDKRVVSRAVQALADLDTAAAREALLAALRDPRWETREQAARALSFLRDHRLGRRLAGLLIDDALPEKPSHERSRSVEWLCALIVRHGFTERLDEIRAAAEVEQDHRTKGTLETCAQHLTLVAGHPADDPWWHEALRSADGDLRDLAVRRLTDIGDDASTAAVAAAFDDVDDNDRASILHELAWAANPQASDLVARVLEDPEFDTDVRKSIRDEAAWAARRIGGRRMTDALRTAAVRREGRDYPALVYLSLLAGKDALPVLESVWLPRLRYPGSERGAEQVQLDWIMRRLRQGRGLTKVDLPPERIDPSS